MSNPINASFDAAWNRLAPRDSRKVTLALIELSVPSSLTLRYATTEVTTPDGETWQSGLMVDAIRQSVDFMGMGVAPADAAIRLAKRPDACQADGTLGRTNQDLLSRFAFQNAVVTIFFWIEGYPDFSQAPQMFKGKVSRPAQVDPTGTTLYLLQDLTWNRGFPEFIDVVNYPDSPDVSQASVVPRFYGDGRAPGMIPPWTSAYGSKKEHDEAGGAQGVLPLVLVDSGVGSNKVKLLGAGHDLAKLFDRTAGMSAFIAGADGLHPLGTTGVTEVLGSSESYLTIDDEIAFANGAVLPVDVRTSGAANTALNPRRAMDPFNLASYATLDQSTGNGVLQLILPNLQSLGSILLVSASVAFIGDAANTHNLRVDAYIPTVGPGGFSTINTPATGTTPQVLVGTWSSSYWTQAWDFGGSANPWDIRVDFAGGTTNKAKILWCVLVVRYRPQRSVVTPLKSFYTYVLEPGYKAKRSRNYKRPVLNVIDPVYQLEGQFYGNFKGVPDDGSGTYTGSAGAVIERPPDIMRHLLEDVAGVDPADIETGVGASGSFVDARALLRNAQPNDFKLACYFNQRTTVQKALQKIAEQSLSCVYLDRLTNKWLAFVWKRGATPNYGRRFSWLAGDFSSAPVAEEDSVVDVRQGMRIRYMLDHWKQKTLFEAFVNPTGSGQGLNMPFVRDQKLTVDATNDTIDWSQGGTHAATISHGTRSPIATAEAVRTGMRAVLGSNNIEVGFGFSIKSGFNNKLDFDVAGVNYVATLDEFDYTAEGLAAEVVRAVNAAAPVGFELTSGVYDHASNTFTFVGSAAFRFDGTSGAANFATSAVHVLNDYSHGVAATSWTSLVRRYGDRFWLGAPGGSSFNALWGTGANLATSIGPVLGYAPFDSGSTTDNPAIYSRGDREHLASNYETVYGPHEEEAFVADFIREENSAVELRNRRFDLKTKPPVLVSFNTHRAIGMRPMVVFDFDADVDPHTSFIGYGTDGSWAGKAIVALEVEQRCGPDYSAEIQGVVL